MFLLFLGKIYNTQNLEGFIMSEAPTRGVSKEKLFLTIFYISQKITCVRVSF